MPGETIIQTVTEVVEVPVEVIVTETVTTTIEVPVQFVSFGEAPALLQKVQGGLLEPVEDRLPLEPMVIPVFEEIGRYGGTIHGNFLGRSDYWAWGRLNKRGLARHSVDGSTIVPALAKGWEVTTDQKTWTFFLREGTKWSDGTPLTADDFLFFYEDIILNDELAPASPEGGRVPTPSWARSRRLTITLSNTPSRHPTPCFSRPSPRWTAQVERMGSSLPPTT